MNPIALSWNEKELHRAQWQDSRELPPKEQRKVEQFFSIIGIAPKCGQNFIKAQIRSEDSEASRGTLRLAPFCTVNSFIQLINDSIPVRIAARDKPQERGYMGSVFANVHINID
jgi:hypothetical protein